MEVIVYIRHIHTVYYNKSTIFYVPLKAKFGRFKLQKMELDNVKISKLMYIFYDIINYWNIHSIVRNKTYKKNTQIFHIY